MNSTRGEELTITMSEQMEERAPARTASQSTAAELLTRARETDDPQERAALLDEAVTLHLPLARSLAMRYQRRGEPLNDLVQVAALGLVKAVQGYDPGKGPEFLSYAVPTITGEIKRHFRDRGWAIRPPRRLQELRLNLGRATEQLTHELQRSPRTSEVAERLGVSEDDVIEAMTSARDYRTTSLEVPVDGEGGTSLGELLGSEDAHLGEVDDAVSLAPLLAKLPARERRILILRFYRSWTQSQIAEDIGVTQMQVSRLLSSSLARLRAELEHARDADGV